jgi:hypothetical protein
MIEVRLPMRGDPNFDAIILDTIADGATDCEDALRVIRNNVVHGNRSYTDIELGTAGHTFGELVEALMLLRLGFDSSADKFNMRRHTRHRTRGRAGRSSQLRRSPHTSATDGSFR